MKNDPPRYFENSRPIYKNWYPEEEFARQELLKHLYNENETFASIDIEFESNRSHISHSRFLKIEFENGKTLTIRFDQGMGYWQVNAVDKYPFHAEIETQLSWIKQNKSSINITNSQGHPTHIYVKLNG